MCPARPLTRRERLQCSRIRRLIVPAVPLVAVVERRRPPGPAAPLRFPGDALFAEVARMVRLLCRMALAAVVGLAAGHARGQVLYTGTNLSGAEFGQTSLPGTYNTDYTYPTNAEVDYFVGKGMNTFRLPFRWERLQQSQNAALNAAELARLSSFVTYATNKGAYVIIDPHNFARYYPPGGNQESTANIVGSAAVPNSAFADFWSKVANTYKANSRVIFNLMNEPNNMPTEQWVSAANAAIQAIRATGATNLVLVPGNGYTGAWTWSSNFYGTPNSQAMLNVTDPGNNFAFDVHQYLDNDGSGTSSTITNNDPTIGAQRLSGFTQWLHANNRRGFLGEFAAAGSTVGTGSSQIGDETLQNMLTHIQGNSDVWLGWTWWSAGPWWPSNYMFLLDPAGSQDKPQMGVLQPFFAPVPEPGTLGLTAAAAGLAAGLVRRRRAAREFSG
jgi:endoglucanase